MLLCKKVLVNQNKSECDACPDAKRGDDLKHEGLFFNASHLGVEFGLVEALAFVACPVSVFHVVHLEKIKPKIRAKVNT
jgi:hypothetical protein